MTSGRPGLNFFDKQGLAMTGDESKAAVGRRLRALRLSFGLSPEYLGSAGYRDTQHILDAEAGLIMPGSSVIHYFWHNWRIPDEFVTEGRKLDLLPVHVAQRIFDQLSRP